MNTYSKNIDVNNFIHSTSTSSVLQSQNTSAYIPYGLPTATVKASMRGSVKGLARLLVSTTEIVKKARHFIHDERVKTTRIFYVKTSSEIQSA